MDIQELNDSFYTAIKSSLLEFIKTENNKEVYAIVFDCDSSIGMISLRYGNNKAFERNLKDFEKYEYMYKPYGKNGLHGFKYSVGDFNSIKWTPIGEIEQFLDSYYYYMVGDYYGDDEPIKNFRIGKKILDEAEIEIKINEIWEEMIINCINRLKQESIGLDVTDDFVMFMCDHDVSNEEMDIYIQKTVDHTLFKKLLSESNKK